MNLHVQPKLAALIALPVMLTAGGVANAEPLAQPAPTCTVPPQGIVVTIDVPGPGSVISPGGNVVVQGTAYDITSPAPPSIDRVSVFLGDRDAGGIFWGDATLQQPSPQLGANLPTAGWSRRSPTIPPGSGARDIFAYAHSVFSNREASTSVTVFLGAAPTAVRGQVPTAVTGPLPACTPTPAPTATATSTPTLAPTATPFTLAPAPTLPAVPPAAPPAQPAPPPPAVIPPPAAPPAAAAPPPAVAPATAQATAPRGGGAPVELGALIVAIGASVASGGLALRRRERARRD